MAFQVQITITGNKTLIAKLGKLEDGLLDFTDAMKTIGEAATSYYAGQVFASQGGILGVPWQQDAPATLSYKRSHYRSYANSTLIRTGVMKNSFVADTTKNSATITNTAPYFVYHQSTAPRTKMPYRPMMAITSDLTNTFESILTDDISEKVRQAA